MVGHGNASMHLKPRFWTDERNRRHRRILVSQERLALTPLKLELIDEHDHQASLSACARSDAFRCSATDLGGVSPSSARRRRARSAPLRLPMKPRHGRRLSSSSRSSPPSSSGSWPSRRARRRRKNQHRQNSRHTLGDKLVADTAAIAYERDTKERRIIFVGHRRAEMHLLPTIRTRRRTDRRLVGRLVCHDRAPLAVQAGAQLVSRPPTPED